MTIDVTEKPELLETNHFAEEVRPMCPHAPSPHGRPVLIAVGRSSPVVLVVAGGLLTWGSRFADDYVSDELASQNIFFPDQARSRRRAARTSSGTPGSRSPPATRPRPTPATSAATSKRSPTARPTPNSGPAAGGQGERPGGHRRRRERGTVDELQAEPTRSPPSATPVPGRDPARPAAVDLRLVDDRPIAGIAAIAAFVAAGAMAVLVVPRASSTAATRRQPTPEHHSLERVREAGLGARPPTCPYPFSKGNLRPGRRHPWPGSPNRCDPYVRSMTSTMHDHAADPSPTPRPPPRRTAPSHRSHPPTGSIDVLQDGPTAATRGRCSSSASPSSCDRRHHRRRPGVRDDGGAPP